MSQNLWRGELLQKAQPSAEKEENKQCLLGGAGQPLSVSWSRDELLAGGDTDMSSPAELGLIAASLPAKVLLPLPTAALLLTGTMGKARQWDTQGHGQQGK